MIDPNPHPPWFDPSLPSREDCVLPCLLAARADATPARDFLLWENGTRWSYGETYALARRVASGLRKLGVKPADTVLAWLPNGPDAVRAWFGINLAGACYAPLNLAYRGRMLAHAIEQSGARIMIVHSGLLDRLQELPRTLLETLVVVGDRPADFAWAGSVIGGDVLDHGDDGAPDANVERWDP